MRRKKTQANNLPLVAAVIAALFLAPLAGVVFIIHLYGSVSFSQPMVKDTHAALQELEAEPFSTKPIAIALLGYGGGDHDGGKLTDTIILAEVDVQEKLLTLVSVPRDLWVPLPVRSNQEVAYKINAAYAIGSDDEHFPLKPETFKGEHGGGEMAKEALETVTGVKPDYYLAVSFAGFLKAIDLLGGVTVDAPVTFDDPYYPITGKETDPCGKSEAEIAELMRQYRDFELERQFVCRYEQLHFNAGPQVMSAETALKFVRSRHSGQHGSDFSRSQRQQALLEGVRRKVLSFSFLTKVVPLIQELSRQVDTDLDLSAARKLYGMYQQMQGFRIRSVQLTTDNVLQESHGTNGQYILIPKAGIQQWSQVHTMVAEQLAGTSSVVPTDTSE